MSDFQNLLAAALIGTSRASAPAHAGTALADALNAVSGRDTEGTLLARAAVAGLAERAGRQAPQNVSLLPEPAPAETLPEAPARAARHLPLVMGTPVLHEWLTLCAGAGWRVPPAHLPELLDRARQDTELREKLRPVLGERGAWLAQFNPEWRFTPATFNEDAWEDATEAGREAIFRTLRADDPQAARDLLHAQFKTERAGSRKRLLGVIGETLDNDDLQLEPLLEEALNDRSSDVQEQARALLQRLSASAYNIRMAARLKGMLHYEKAGLLGKLTGKQKTTLHLPETPDPDLKRDGLEGTKTAQARFEAILSGTHPDALLHGLGGTPHDLVHLAKTFGALDELQQAALTTGHVSLAQALLPHGKKPLPLVRLAAQDNLQAELWDAMKHRNAELLTALLDGLPWPWSPDFSGELIGALRHSVRKAEYAYGWPVAWRHIHNITLHRAHPDAPRAAPLPDDAPDFARQTMQELNATLDLRAQMWRDFGVTL